MDGYGLTDGMDKPGGWVKFFAILPVRMKSGERVWCKTVYRRVVISKILMRNNSLSIQETKWEYGTIFDVLKTKL